MSIVSIVNSRLGLTVGISLVRLLPHWLARRLAYRLAARAADQTNSALVQAVRSNQAVVRNLPLDHPSIEAAVHSVLRNTARNYLSLFKAIRGEYAGLLATGELDEEIISRVEACLAEGKGMLFVGPHTVGWDILLLLMGGLGYPVQVLVDDETVGSFAIQNEIRRRFGVDVTPINFGSLRRAMSYLRGGGIVLTGVDRPDAEGELLRFFGRKARLPIGHARLALRTSAPIMVGATFYDGNERYRASCLAFIETTEYAGRSNSEVELAQRVIRELETFIQRHPAQWLMFYPVWPEGAYR